ncbi:MAG: ATP-binding protein [Micropruina glycogenica]
MNGWFAYAPGEPQPDEPGPPDGPSLDLDVAEGLARALRDVLEMAGRAQPRTKSATVDWIESHLGAPLGELTTVTTEWPAWRHASVQSGVEAYLPPGVEWIGLRSRHVEHMALIDLLMHEPGMGQTLAQPQLIEVATGPDTMADAFRVALCRLATDDGSPVVLCLRRSDEHGPPQVAIELVLSDPKAGAPVLQRLRELVDEHDVLRGQVVTFGPSEHYGNHMVSFLPRPDVGPDDVVLPAGILEQLSHHVLGIGDRAAQLTELGFHLKRGLLLYGPPGTGKTHTVRHLIAQAVEATVIVLSGEGLAMIEPATTLARRLTPSIVVVEDVDLIAQDRDYSPTGNPLLFSLLDAMDGVAADADVTFLLTTNRTAVLEDALVQRPGRVDLAVEIPRPDAAGRERLLRLYARDATLEADLTDAVARTEGVTASAIKELMRRAVLAALDGGGTTITTRVLAACLDDFFADRARLTRALLGDDASAAEAGPPPALNVGDDAFRSSLRLDFDA